MTLEDLALELVYRDLVATFLPAGPEWLVHLQPAEDLAQGVVRCGWVGEGPEIKTALLDALNKYDASRIEQRGRIQ